MTDHAGLDWVLLNDYLMGEASAEDAATLERWIGDNPERVALVQKFQQAWEQSDRASVSHFDRAAAERNIFSRIAAQPTMLSEKHHRSAHERIPGRTTVLGVRSLRPWIAAVGVFCSAIILAIVSMRHDVGHAEVAQRTYATGAGERATVSLTDGSRIVLGPLTTMHVGMGGERGGISVALTGEALFTVSHNPRTPFSVQVGHTVVRVLGTTFSARRYASDGTTRIVVADGRVAVQPSSGVGADAHAAVLGAGMLCLVNDTGRINIVSNIAVDTLLTWTTGRLRFDAVPLPEALADLGRAYDVDFHVADSTLGKASLTWSVATNTVSLAMVLEELGGILESHFIRSGRVITIVRGRSASSPIRIRRQPFTSETQYGR